MHRPLAQDIPCLAADTGEAVVRHATGKELVGELRDDRSPQAVLAREAVVEDRLQSMRMV